jgi:hypothetical protein
VYRYRWVAPLPLGPDGQVLQSAYPTAMQHHDFGVIVAGTSFGLNGTTMMSCRYWIVPADRLAKLGGSGILLGAVLVAFERASRRAGETHKCGTCGYDLRATPDRCPECGQVVAADEPPAK